MNNATIMAMKAGRNELNTTRGQRRMAIIVCGSLLRAKRRAARTDIIVTIQVQVRS